MSNNPRTITLLLKIGAGLLLFVAVVSVFGGIRELQLLSELNWYQTWQVLFWTLVINTIAAMRWRLLMNHVSLPPVPVIKLMKVVFIGRLLGHSTSQMVGDLGSRFVYLKTKNMDIQKGSLSIMLDKSTEILLLMSVFMAFFIWILLGKTAISPFLSFMITCVLMCCIFAMGIRFLPHLMDCAKRYILKKRLPSGGDSLRFDSIRVLLIVLTVGKYTAVVFRFSAILALCGINLSFDRVFWGTAIAQLGLVAGITPGGLGFVEAGWAGALHFFHVHPSLIAGFLVMQRLLIFLSVIVLSLLIVPIEKNWPDEETGR